MPVIARARVAAALIALCLGGSPAHAQQRPRIGFVANSLPAESLSQNPRAHRTTAAFVDRLRELGWVPGRDVEIIWRSAGGDERRIPGLISGLVSQKVDVLVVGGNIASRHALDATKTIPVVTAAVVMPVETGLVKSLSKPGGNLTGVTMGANSFMTKRLALLKETVPGISRVGVLGWPGKDRLSDETLEAARALGLSLKVVNAAAIGDVDAAFRDAQLRGAQGMLVLDWPLTTAAASQPAVAAAATKYRLPAISSELMYAEAGGLLAYASDVRDNFRVAAQLVDRILRGARPGDLPMEQPSKVQLRVNLLAARAIGVAVPASVLLQADRVLGQ